MKRKNINFCNPVRLEVLIKKGHQQVKKYNWWECARKTEEIYKKVLS
jgi:hypothetical protein